MTRRELFLALYLPSLLLAFVLGMQVPTMPLYAKGFGVSVGLVAVAVAAQPFGTMLADVPAGMVMARLGRRRLMLAGAAMVALSCLGLAQAHVFWELVAYRVVGGVGSALWGISRLAFVADAVPLVSRGRALSTFGGMQRIGTFVGPAVGGFIAAAVDLRAAFVVAGLIGLAAVVASFAFVRETGTATAGGHRARWRLLGSVLRRQYKDLLAAGSAQVFAQMIRQGRQLIVPLYGAQALGLDVAAVGTIVSLSALIDMSLFWPAGMLMDRLGRKYASIPSFVVMALGMAMVPLAGGFAGLLAATAVMGLGNGLGAGTMMTLGADLAPPEAAGEFLGLWRLVGDGGAVGGPLLVGGIADLVGLAPAALVLAGVGVLAAVTIYAFVQETLAPAATAPGGTMR